MSKKVVIIGAGGHAREVLDLFDACNIGGQNYEVLGYIVESRFGSPGTVVNDKPILGDFSWFKGRNEVSAICGVGKPELRKRLVGLAKQFGVRFINVIHPSAIMTPWITLGEGVVITAGCILTNQIHVGNHVHVNRNSTIGHNCVIEDFVMISPGVNISGNVLIREGCFIGTGANIIDKINLGQWSIIGAGSTIIREVPPNSTVVGVPGKVVNTREDGWHLI